jgi:hypothetical protein
MEVYGDGYTDRGQFCLSTPGGSLLYLEHRWVPILQKFKLIPTPYNRPSYKSVVGFWWDTQQQWLKFEDEFDTFGCTLLLPKSLPCKDKTDLITDLGLGNILMVAFQIHVDDHCHVTYHTPIRNLSG